VIRAIRAFRDPGAAVRRLNTLVPLDDDATFALTDALTTARPIKPRRELIGEGHEIVEPLLILSGWAARVRFLADGRRQFLSFLLPGDVVGLGQQSRPVATATVIALTPVEICSAPLRDKSPALAEAYALSRALDEAYLLANITRLGRLNAQERIGDLFLELLERLRMAGLESGNSFALPLTQEMIADALGLTSVHVNRMIQLFRREGDLTWKTGRLTLTDPVALARKINRQPVRVSAIRFGTAR